MERKMTVSVYKMKQNVTGVRAASSPKSTRQSPGTGIVVPKEPFLRFKDSWSLRLHTENETANVSLTGGSWFFAEPSAKINRHQ
jgi:hypothetical protein